MKLIIKVTAFLFKRSDLGEQKVILIMTAQGNHQTRRPDSGTKELLEDLLNLITFHVQLPRSKRAPSE